MLQLARIVTYGAFVLLTYLAIRQAPFGKRIFLILALTPMVLIQTVSITRDALLMGACFYLTAKALSMAYSEAVPSKGDWIETILLSMLLAPCKMIYLPAGFLWLLVIYRRYLRGQNPSRKRGLALAAAMAFPILLFFVLSNLGSIASVAAALPGLAGEKAYSLAELLKNPGLSLYLLFNTLRDSLGSILANAISPFELQLGCSDGIVMVVLLLMLLELFQQEPGRSDVSRQERTFLFLVFLGVFLLAALASMQWTPGTSTVIQGLQGRYLTPVLPALCLSLFGFRLVKTHPRGVLAVRLGCCLYPAVVSLNMYLWTIFDLVSVPF